METTLSGQALLASCNKVVAIPLHCVPEVTIVKELLEQLFRALVVEQMRSCHELRAFFTWIFFVESLFDELFELRHGFLWHLSNHVHFDSASNQFVWVWGNRKEFELWLYTRFGV